MLFKYYVFIDLKIITNQYFAEPSV